MQFPPPVPPAPAYLVTPQLFTEIEDIHWQIYQGERPETTREIAGHWGRFSELLRDTVARNVRRVADSLVDWESEAAKTAYVDRSDRVAGQIEEVATAGHEIESAIELLADIMDEGREYINELWISYQVHMQIYNSAPVGGVERANMMSALAEHLGVFQTDAVVEEEAYKNLWDYWAQRRRDEIHEDYAEPFRQLNPSPSPSEDVTYSRIPYWVPLGYVAHDAALFGELPPFGGPGGVPGLPGAPPPPPVTPGLPPGIPFGPPQPFAPVAPPAVGPGLPPLVPQQLAPGLVPPVITAPSAPDGLPANSPLPPGLVPSVLVPPGTGANPGGLPPLNTITPPGFNPGLSSQPGSQPGRMAPPGFPPGMGMPRLPGMGMPPRGNQREQQRRQGPPPGGGIPASFDETAGHPGHGMPPGMPPGMRPTGQSGRRQDRRSGQSGGGMPGAPPLPPNQRGGRRDSAPGAPAAAPGAGVPGVFAPPTGFNPPVLGDPQTQQRRHRPGSPAEAPPGGPASHAGGIGGFNSPVLSNPHQTGPRLTRSERREQERQAHRERLARLRAGRRTALAKDVPEGTASVLDGRLAVPADQELGLELPTALRGAPLAAPAPDKHARPVQPADRTVRRPVAEPAAAPEEGLPARDAWEVETPGGPVVSGQPPRRRREEPDPRQLGSA